MYMLLKKVEISRSVNLEDLFLFFLSLGFVN